MNRMAAIFRNLSLPYIFLCIIITTFLSMAAHSSITHYLKEPSNSLSNVWIMDLAGKKGLLPYCENQSVALATQNKNTCVPTGINNLSLNIKMLTILSAVKLLITAIQIFAAIIFFKLINQHWTLKNFWFKVIAFAFLFAAINEEFLRMYLMEIIADHRNISYEFLLMAIPIYISYFFTVFTIAILVTLQQKHWWINVLFFIAAVLFYQYLPGFAHSFLMSIFPLNRGGYLESRALYSVITHISSFVTFFLPIIAMYVAYIWIRDSLPSKGKVVLYFLLLIGITGKFLPILQIITSQGNIFYRILYYGSFWWELLVAAYLIVFFVERKLNVLKQY